MNSVPEWLEVNVIDRGKGLYTVGPTSTSGDSGFGLFNLRERLSHLGGDFEFDSNPGAGTRVSIRVPRTPPL